MIANIKSTFMRRLLTILALPIVFLVGMTLLPLAAFIDYLIAMVKCTIRFPVSIYEVEKELVGTIEQAFKEGWYGSRDFGEELDDVVEKAKVD